MPHRFDRDVRASNVGPNSEQPVVPIAAVDYSEYSVAFPEPVTFGFGMSTKTAKPVLNDVALNLKHGSRCLLVGFNGAGKSTLLRLLGGKVCMLLGWSSGLKFVGCFNFFCYDSAHDHHPNKNTWARRIPRYVTKL